jgi:RNA polymerase sigma-70 factor (ECF subfamily)
MGMTDSAEFTRLADPFRRELLAHCYRMLGSVHDAEDLVQETYLRAWRAFDSYDETRASLRTWLHRIATNACLTALERRAHRALPSGLADPTAFDPAEYRGRERRPEIPWLQPFPDAIEEDPASVVLARGSIRLAFIAALQHLPPRPRAVLILRDVLSWRAAEVAELLDTTTTAVNSALRRARALIAELAPAESDVTEPASAADRKLITRYLDAFERSDVRALERLLREDVVLEMPPILTWFSGRETLVSFYTYLFDRLGDDAWRMVPVSANGQPAAGAYLRDDNGVHRAHSVQVLTSTGGRLTRISGFIDASLFPTFGLPLVTLADRGQAFDRAPHSVAGRAGHV